MKISTSFRMNVEAIEKLKKISEDEKRSMTNMLERLIEKEYEKIKISLYDVGKL